MKKLMEQFDGTAFSDLIRSAPELDVPIDGVRGWVIGNDTHQVVFFDIQPGVEVPLHSHCAQWGMVVEGEMTLTIGDETHTYGPGAWYVIPEGTMHGAKVAKRMSVIDIFDAPDRYKTK
ncbi:MAG: cupin domain-containing protein [candidate division Zixibacteria bacterium]|nr:cupin domain-containing protein [candidate division Zixibacteria bacterium]MDH3938455.1 cupin domain-containing protein [candidate division Zixibacteria bacterium]MDH4034535.1 cupin domain-containing protein [candidate division Zixibacteria bacterium]